MSNLSYKMMLKYKIFRIIDMDYEERYKHIILTSIYLMRIYTLAPRKTMILRGIRRVYFFLCKSFNLDTF